MAQRSKILYYCFRLSYSYPATRGFSFAWLLAFTKLRSYEVVRVACLSRSWFVYAQLRDSRHANDDFVNAKSPATEKPVLAEYLIPVLSIVSCRRSWSAKSLCVIQLQITKQYSGQSITIHIVLQHHVWVRPLIVVIISNIFKSFFHFFFFERNKKNPE